MPAPANLVHETSSSTGTGNLTLAAVNGKQRFSGAFSTGATQNVFDYFISNRGATEWERGTGHMSDANTLVRDTVIESTNSNNAVNFSAGTKDVCNDIPAGNQTRFEGSTVTDGHAVVFDGTTGRLFRSAGSPPAAIDLVLLANGTWSAVSEIAFTDLTDSYFKYTLICDSVLHSDDNVTLSVQASDDNGSSYLSNDYAGGAEGRMVDFNGTSWSLSSWSWSTSPAFTALEINGNLSNAGNGHAFEFQVINPATAVPTCFILSGGAFQVVDANEKHVGINGTWYYTESTAITAFKLAISAGTFEGRYQLYGWRAA